MSLTDTIREDVLSYAGLVPPAPSELGAVLADIVAAHGTDVFLSQDELRPLLEAGGLDAQEVLRVLLLTQTTGFRALMEARGAASQADLDRFVRNAIDQSGLNRAEVIRICGALALAAGAAYSYAEASQAGDTLLSEEAFVVPSQLYGKSLTDFGRQMGQALQKGTPLYELDYTGLEPLVHAGIPKAKYYMGYCLLHGYDDADSRATGFKLLQEAASAGDVQACAELGDYCYQQGTSEWVAAHAYYTGVGALALNKKRREALVNILNRRRFNFLMLVAAAVLAAAMLVTTVLSVGAPAFGGHVVLGLLSSLLSAGVLVLGFLHHKAEPYDDAYLFPFAVFVLWALFMAIRFAF